MSQDDIWRAEEDGGFSEEGFNVTDSRSFTIPLESQGQPGDFHVRNRPGEKQRKAVSVSYGGRKRRPAFTVAWNAKAMIHGNMGAPSRKSATLLVYELKFNSYNGARIKEADIILEFRAAEGLAGGPSVHKIKPTGLQKMEETTENESWTKRVELSAKPPVAPVEASLSASGENSIEKVTKHHTIVIGDMPQDDWGNFYQARFNLYENKSQKTGIPSKLVVCILLERENDDDFYCDPYLKVTPDFTTEIKSVFSKRTPDEEIWFSVEEPSYNTLDDRVTIDPDNLGATNLNDIWDCTMYYKYGEAVKETKGGNELII